MGFGQCGADAGRNQPIGRHIFADRSSIVGGKAHVAIGQDTHQLARAIGDWHATDPIAVHHLLGSGERGIRCQRNRIHDHTTLAAFYLVDFLGLVGNREVAVNDTQTTLASQSNR